MDKNKFNRNLSKRHGGRQQQLYLNIAFFGVFACAALIFLLLAFDKIPPVSEHKKTQKETISTETQSETGTESTTPKETLAAETSITISLMGDCTLGSAPDSDQYNNFGAFKTVYGIDYFFQNVKSYLQSDDLSIINLEGALTTAENSASKSDVYKGDPSYVSALSDSSIEAANLANDHTEDYGTAGLTETQTTLKDAGITAFGNDDTAVLEIKGIKVGLVGISAVDKQISECQTQLTSAINSVKEQGANLIIVNFHWGNDGETTPNSDQTTLAHAAVDAGADLVVGHHPHVLQGMEVYNNRTIFYSLGSFCDGGNMYPNDMDTVIFQPTFTFNTSKELTSTTNSIIPCTISSDSTFNNYQPTPAEDSEKTRIEQKIKDLSSQIGNSISGTDSSSDSNNTTDSNSTSDSANTTDSDNTSISDGDTTASSESETSSESESSSETSSDGNGSDGSDNSGSSGNNSTKLFLPD